MNKVFNDKIGSPTDFELKQVSKEDARMMLAGLFEQIMLFDRVTISTNRVNFQLIFLIDQLGINMVEELLDRNIIEFLLWSPLLFTGRGRTMDDGTNDTSVIFGQPPIVAGGLVADDLDIEKQIDKALSMFSLHRDRKRIFKRRAFDKFIVPDGLKNSGESAKLVIDAYVSNNLVDLPYQKEPNQLEMFERDILMDLGYKVLEIKLLSEYQLKSFENFDHYKICEQNLKNIGKAYKVSDNTSEILKVENMPNLKNLFLLGNLKFADVMQLRYKSNSKYFRKWINQISENHDVHDISKEYINEIKGSNNFFETNVGKLVKNIGVFGIGMALGDAITGAEAIAANFALGQLDTFVLDGLLRGKKPSMFLNDIANMVKRV